ncbi:MAG: aldehyde dehydrogenase family protein [Chloroflexi bacterium]|nr:aldehyde dehydrogenase family protein [Chloroflexota bacterium]
MAEEYFNYINGKWSRASSGKTYENIDPANGDVLGLFPLSGPEEVDRAVEAASRSSAKWRKLPAPKRAEILFRAAEIMVQRKEELARRMTMEMGKVLKEARGDVQEGIDMVYYMAGEGRRLFGDTTPSELPNKFAMSMRVPIGVVAAITPWNFPLAIPTWKVMPALVAGNTVVFKPSPFTPESAYHVVKILEEAGLPPGVLNLIYGEGSALGVPLVEDPRVTLISFTGSVKVGNEVAQRASRLGKRYSLEMGGKNAIIVMEDADLDLAVEGIIWSAFGTSGQRCTAASRILIQRSILGRLTERVVGAAERLRLGHGLLPTTDVGPVINQAAVDKILGYLKIGVEEGAKVLTGGYKPTEGEMGKGYFIKPTVFGDVKPHMRIAQEEIFGPVTDLIAFDTLEEAVKINNDTPYGLVTSIFTRDTNKAFRAMEDITTGIVYVNAGTIGAEVHLPFGGTRGTGNGHREAGQAALDVFTEWKTVYVDYSGRLQKAQMGD